MLSIRRLVGRASSRAAVGLSCDRRRNASTRNRLFEVAEEVQEALNAGQPVVALETTIYTHGFPYPENVALASNLESLVRINGGVPATIGVVRGKARVGMSPEELIELASTAGQAETRKISRRDLGFIGGLGLRGKPYYGGTTISGTMVLAHLAGIKIFATGGLGGVHRGGENSMDVSADLTELGRTPVAVISSGCKSFLDIPRTLEYLETQGVGVGTFADGRQGHVDFPGVFSRDSGVKSPQVIANEADAAAIAHAQFSLPVHSGLLFANPVPEAAAMSKLELDHIIQQAIAEADAQGFSGSANTPFILKRIRELSHNATVTANRALVEANIIRGTRVAVELAKLEQADRNSLKSGLSQSMSVPTVANGSLSSRIAATNDAAANIDILVAGSLACDYACDFHPFAGSNQVTPVLRTSNPAQINQSSGGVGRNVATAASFAGARVALASAVANDAAGTFLIKEASESGVDTRMIATIDGAHTAQYISVNDKNKDLVLAMADFSIFESTHFDDAAYWDKTIKSATPKWVVLDGNWSPSVASHILSASKANGVPVAFEPVSTAKAARAISSLPKHSHFPDHPIELATPNILELASMYQAASARGLFESDAWFELIDALSLPNSGARDKFVSATNSELVDAGVPQQVIRLLPFIPAIITKLGSQGALLSMILRKGDPRLTDPAFAPHILSRSTRQNSPVGGLYMRLYPPSEIVPQVEIVSVNGVGDTLLGVLMAGIVATTRNKEQLPLDQLIPVAQQAAIMTLKSDQSVSHAIKTIKSRISGWL